MAEANSYVIGKQVFATKILDNRVKYWPDDGARQSTWVDRQKDIALLLYFLILKFCSFQYHFDKFPAFTVICHQNTFHLYACKVNSEWSWMVPGQSFIKCNNNKRSLIFSSVQGIFFFFCETHLEASAAAVGNLLSYQSIGINQDQPALVWVQGPQQHPSSWTGTEHPKFSFLLQGHPRNLHTHTHTQRKHGWSVADKFFIHILFCRDSTVTRCFIMTDGTLILSAELNTRCISRH